MSFFGCFNYSLIDVPIIILGTLSGCRENRATSKVSPRAQRQSRRTKAKASIECVASALAPRAVAPRSSAKCNMFVVSIEIEALRKGEKARGRENERDEGKGGAGYRGTC